MDLLSQLIIQVALPLTTLFCRLPISSIQVVTRGTCKNMVLTVGGKGPSTSAMRTLGFSVENSYTPQCSSIKGLIASIRWYLGYLKG